MTNLEKIKSYSADEMALFLTGDIEHLINESFCNHCQQTRGECTFGCMFSDIEACKWWLEQEANI